MHALRTESFLSWAETGLVPGHLLLFPALGARKPWVGCFPGWRVAGTRLPTWVTACHVSLGQTLRLLSRQVLAEGFLQRVPTLQLHFFVATKGGWVECHRLATHSTASRTQLSAVILTSQIRQIYVCPDQPPGTAVTVTG
jgi:hypothetical protein